MILGSCGTGTLLSLTAPSPARRPPSCRRYAAHLGRDTFLPSGVAACNDFEGISPWADDSLYWAAGIGLLAWGADGRPEPQGTLSPEELEQALARFFDRPVPAVPYLLEHW